MAALCGDFELWLADKLRTLNIDPDVFGSYITGILEGTETEEEKSEALQGILTEVCEDGISEVKDEIFDKWSIYTQSPAEDVRVDDEGRYNVEAKLVSLMEEQAKSVIPEKSVTVEEQKLRQAILAQYAEVSDGEEESGPVPKAAAAPETVTAAASTGAPHKEHYAPKYEVLARNTNAETVAHAEKEKRELSKQEHERKKAQDKLNREKQKQQQQDRKEKERKRTQKGERRR